MNDYKGVDSFRFISKKNGLVLVFAWSKDRDFNQLSTPL